MGNGDDGRGQGQAEAWGCFSKSKGSERERAGLSPPGELCSESPGARVQEGQRGPGAGPPMTFLNQEPMPFVPLWKVLESLRGPGLFTTVAALCFSLK